MSIVPPEGGSHHPTATQELLTWTCDGCGDPILSGVITVRYEDIHEARRARRESGGLDQVHWHAWHDACDPHPGAWTEYWIGTSQLATDEAVLWWTRHLEGKGWFAVTDWGDFLRRQINGAAL